MVVEIIILINRKFNSFYAFREIKSTTNFTLNLTSNHKRNNRYDPYQPRPNQFSNLLANRVVDNYKKHGTTRKKIQSLSKKMNFPEFDFSWATNSNNNAAEGDEDDFDESYESKPVSISNHLRWKEVERNDEINGRRRNDLVSKIRDIEVGGNGSGSNRYNQNLSLSEAQKVLAVQDWTETDSTLTLPLNLKPHRTTLHMKSTQSNNPTSSIRKHHRFNYTTEDEDEVKSYNPSNYSPKRFYSPEINDDVDQSTSKISRYNSTLAMDDLNAEIVRMKNEGEGVNSSKVHNHSNEKRVDLDSVNNREVEELQSEEAEDDILEFPSSTQYFKSNDIDPDQTTSNIKLSEHGFPLSIENQNSISVVAAVNQQRSPTPFDSTTTVPEIPISSLISSPQLSPYGTPTLNSDKTLSIQDSYYLALASKLSRDFFEPKESWWTSNWYDMEKMEVGLNEDCEKEEEEEEGM